MVPGTPDTIPDIDSFLEDGLLADAFPFPGLAALDRSLRDFLAEWDDLGRDLTEGLGEGELVSWLVGAGVTVTAVGVARRLRKRARSDAGPDDAEDDPTDPWPVGPEVCVGQRPPRPLAVACGTDGHQRTISASTWGHHHV